MIQISKSKQNVDYSEIYESEGHKLWIRIRSNAYDCQSHAHVHRFDGTQWQLVYEILPGAMSTLSGLVYRLCHKDKLTSKTCGSHFETDRDLLLGTAMMILGI